MINQIRMARNANRPLSRLQRTSLWAEPRKLTEARSGGMDLCCIRGTCTIQSSISRDATITFGVSI